MYFILLFPIYIGLSIGIGIPYAYFKLLSLVFVNCVLFGESKIAGILYFLEVAFTGYPYFLYWFIKNDIKHFI